MIVRHDQQLCIILTDDDAGTRALAFLLPDASEEILYLLNTHIGNRNDRWERCIHNIGYIGRNRGLRGRKLGIGNRLRTFCLFFRARRSQKFTRYIVRSLEGQSPDHAKHNRKSRNRYCLFRKFLLRLRCLSAFLK